jgi:hypothetical protein
MCVQVFDCHAGINQRWYIDTQSRIHSYQYPNRCVDVAAVMGAPMGVVANCSAAATQRFDQLGECHVLHTRQQEQELPSVLSPSGAQPA